METQPGDVLVVDSVGLIEPCEELFASDARGLALALWWMDPSEIPVM
jgi:hypothetical protein